MVNPDFPLDFATLVSDEGLKRLDEQFYSRFGRATETGSPDSLLEQARHCETMIEELFQLAEELAQYRQRDADFALLQQIKYKFVKRKGILIHASDELERYDPAPARQMWRSLGIVDEQGHFDELAFARRILQWQASGSDQGLLDLAAVYSAWASLSEAGRHRHRGQVLFDHARGLDAAELLHGLDVAPEAAAPQRVIRIRPALLEARQGFELTDSGPEAAHGLDQARYCLICHPSGTDSCSHGMQRGDGTLSRNALGVELSGCPLGERISEFHSLRREGRPIAALAMIMRDNPMVAATGHRICNDCSRACVYQQQTPVDIPGAETRILEDVLALPWGVEIYSLLTRWNPLRPQPAQRRGPSGRKVLIVGLGPAGFTLAHHLLNQGHQVVAIDGQKIEPLAPELLQQPVSSWAAFQEALDERTPAGFGGVAEYGITARWNKNYLKLIRLTLQRRPRFRIIGGVSLGAQLDTDEAFALGFDHIALALGAGKPRLWELPAALPRGVRMASDFLMGLQLGGLYRQDSLSAWQLDLPLAVVGAGLTAVDTATEALAFYALQVERFARRHRLLSATVDGPSYLDALGPAERERAGRFITHGEAILAVRASTEDPAAQARAIHGLMQGWGGVTLIYRGELRHSPAYRLNHEELQKGLAEGIEVRDNCQVTDFRCGDDGSVQALHLRQSARPQALPEQAGESWLPVRTVLLALGTERSVFQEGGNPAGPAKSGSSALPDQAGSGDDEVGRQVQASIAALTKEQFLAGADPRITRYGDMHPAWAGSVVKAMASAARGASLLDGLLAAQASPAAGSEDFEAFAGRLAGHWQARLQANEPLASGIFGLSVAAPAAARRFRPGQFYRLQNFETGTRPATEPMAMTGASALAGGEQLNMIVLQNGTSTSLAADWQPGQPLILMGPCGQPSEIPQGKKVLLIGGGLGNAVLLSIGEACRANACEVTYIAGYRSPAQVFSRDALEAAADRVLWCFEDGGSAFAALRDQDQVVHGTVMQALQLLAATPAGATPHLGDIEHLLVIGSDRMMAAVAQACSGELANRLRQDLKMLASVNAPMQCMMKGICGQCLQAVQDPASGQVRHVFICEQQDQPLCHLDFAQLHQRLQQNLVLETQHAAWLARARRAS